MTDASSLALQQARADYERLAAQGLALDIQRGQPSDADFDLAEPLLGMLAPGDHTSDSGLDIRNYPGGVYGLPEARDLFAEVLDLKRENVLVGNNSSLELQARLLTLGLLRGMPGGAEGWLAAALKDGTRPRLAVTVPGYDRHFTMAEGLGFDLAEVPLHADGPDLGVLRELVRDPHLRGLLMVPTFSNPGGESLSAEVAHALLAMRAAAPDFTVFADDAYRVHGLYPEGADPDANEPDTLNLVGLARDAGHPDRPVVFASTSKVTFAGAGLGYLGASEDTLAHIARFFEAQTLGPNKAEQLRHVRFLRTFPGGIHGLMARHAELLRPKFELTEAVLREELAGGEARWTRPRGGYFVHLLTRQPVAARVVELAGAAGLKLTPAGSAYPAGSRHPDAARSIRIAPTRPPLNELETALRVLAACVRLATAEAEAAAHPAAEAASNPPKEQDA